MRLTIFKNLDSATTKEGIKFMLIASLLFSFMGAFAKILSSTLPSIEVVFFRNVFGVIIIMYSFYKTPIIELGGRPFLLFLRGMMGFLALMLFFYNIANIPLAEAMTFSKISPIFTAIFAFLILKEKLSYQAWIGVFVGFIGVLFITKFDGSTLDKTDYLGILSGVGAALAYTSIRELKNYYNTKTIAFSFMLVGTISPLILMFSAEFYSPKNLDFMFSKFIVPEINDIIFIVLLGVFSTYAQIYMTKAYSSTKAGIIGTISYLGIVFSIIVGLFLGDSFPDIFIISGIILIITSGILVARNS